MEELFLPEWRTNSLENESFRWDRKIGALNNHIPYVTFLINRYDRKIKGFSLSSGKLYDDLRTGIDLLM